MTPQAAAALLPESTEEGPIVRVAGRVVAWRAHGKSAFAHLADQSGRIQLYFKKDVLGDEVFALLELFDIGDIIGVDGPLFRTRTGEVTVRVESVEMLAKSLRPLPFGKEEVVDGLTVRHSGFADPEQRYRQRYADLAVHPEMRALFTARTRMIGAIRAVSRRARVSRSRDAGAAAAVRWRGCPAVRHAPQRARHAAVSAHCRRAVPQAAYRGRPRTGVRDRPRLPQRGHRPDAQSGIHDARVLPGVRRLWRHDDGGGGADRRGGASSGGGGGLRRPGAGPGAALSAHRVGASPDLGVGGARRDGAVRCRTARRGRGATAWSGART